MHPDLRTRHRSLVRAYDRYLVADRAWQEAAAVAATWFPDPFPPRMAMIGDPGSRVRRLYERRAAALATLAAAQEKMGVARRRIESRRSASAAPVVVTRLAIVRAD